jgi:hypothetical protein
MRPELGYVQTIALTGTVNAYCFVAGLLSVIGAEKNLFDSVLPAIRADLRRVYSGLWLEGSP